MSNTTLTNVTDAIDLGLLTEEYDQICDILNRTPNYTELSIFSVMWSEHCSYKNSILWLKKLPKSGKNMLVEAGEENAGLVDIGDGLACAFKIESHNHPSALEPYQGAATGVGGINRDIFTMGARPIAQLNSLRFGDIKLDKTQWLLKGVVKGIGDYGNSFGIPIVGGETFFDKSYNANPLVNAFSAGIMHKGDMISAIAKGNGNPVFIVGSATGKDGINGAAFASKDLTQDSVNDIPSVQVGDPFQEKLLLEATMEISKTNALVGMQDMGAAGIICSTSEMSSAGKCGMKIYLDKVPTRQKMEPFEILLSESQERMLLVIKKGKENIVKNIFKKWDLNCEQIGEVTNSKRLEFYFNNECIANVPSESLVLGGGAPVYEREYKEPNYYNDYKKFNISTILPPSNIIKVAREIIKLPNIASKKWIFEQYDSMVGTINMSTNCPSDAAIVNVKGTNKALAMTVDCNARYVHADPKIGCAIAVFEAARNIVCSGGEPMAITNCLNFGNPYDPEVYWQFVNSILGMKEACEALQTPVTGGNVSFYNQTVNPNSTEPCFPTPTIGMIGLVPDKNHIMTLDFKSSGDLIYLIGECHDDISSSEYLANYLNIQSSPAPYFDVNKELSLQKMIKLLIKNKQIKSAHDISDGGLYVNLIESGIVNNYGFDIFTNHEFRQDAYLFGESQSRVVVSIDKNNQSKFENFLKNKTPYTFLGQVTSGKIVIDDVDFGNINSVKEDYLSTIESILNF
ncbi:MAG: phosphoribosylformylglycinamidine synthase II [Flavobacteriales bacterium]|nr:phosphoribosylformylglycinamidine synthase II [Flavobacteriales bacterium]|tara:strand:+ start:26851 stop:29076 length:2226 start_codon:yes stop_codon:yes gene_type:complete